MVSTFEFADNIVGIMVNSNIDSEVVQKVHDEISKRLIDHKKINLYVEIDPGVSISLPAIIKDLTFKFNNSNKFSKIAVVTNMNWLQNIMEIKDLLMNAEIQCFNVENRLDAIQWITE